MTATPHILMCPPEFYGIEYEINPWMDRHRQADHELAVRQWSELHGILTASGAQVSCMTPVKGLPDLVFTANAGLIYRNLAIPSRFRHPQRQQEEEHDSRWFAEHGFQLRPLKSETYLEGAGDALFCGETLFAGYRIRSDVRGHQELGELMQCEVIPLELIDGRFYHLDTCFCPLTADIALYYPPAFDHYARKSLRGRVRELIPIRDDESEHFACNAVVLGKTVVTNAGCPRLHRELRARGFEPVECPLSEFVKAGGSAKCLTLRLDGEDAAAWKQTEGQGPS
jgi:N-dimethylarginine dimethylaminohydrolase